MDYTECTHWRVCNLCCPNNPKDCRHYLPIDNACGETDVKIKCGIKCNALGQCEETKYYVCGSCFAKIGLNDNYCKNCGKKLVFERT